MGLFSVSSVYQLLRGHHEIDQNTIWQHIWRLDVLERLIHGKLLTNNVCSRWGHGTTNCDHCDGEEETNIHVMRDFQLARFVWQHLVPIHGRLAFFAFDYNEWIATNMKISVKIDGGLEWRDV
jgi:hypothetical protein